MTKFEQLLDYIVNEEHDKANELFHEIVVEKSREIYENLIAEEEQEEDVEEAADEEVDESNEEVDESNEEVDESDDDLDESADEEADESIDLEDSYMMDGDDKMDDMGEPGGLEKADDLEGDVSSEEDVEYSIKDAIAQLEAALAAMGAEPNDDDGMGDDGMGDEIPSTEMPADEMMGFMEGRRMTREYVEKVGNDWDKNSMKTQGQYVGAGTGDKEGAPVEGRSPIASGKNKPGPAGVGAKSLNQNHHEGQSNTGTSPGKVNHGVANQSSEKLDKGQGNVPGGKMGVKNLSKVSGGHGAEKKGSGPGPVGSGTGDKAGQTSVSNDKQFLKPYSK